MPPRLGVNLAFLVKRERAGWIYLDEVRIALVIPRGLPPPMQVKKASDRLPAHDVDDRISNGWQ